MVEAAKHVDMMLFSANVTVTIPPAVRKANPDVLCLGYLNVLDFNGKNNGPYLATPGMKEDWPEINKKEDWFLHDENGERILVYIHNGARERYAIDCTNPELQRYMGEAAKEIVDNGYDGVFLDNFGLELLFRRTDKYTGFPADMTNMRWQDGGKNLIVAIKQALGEENPVIFNGLHGGYSTKRSSFQTEGISPFAAAMQAVENCDGGMWEGYFGWSGLSLDESVLQRTVDTLAVFNRLNKVTVALATGDSEHDAEVLFCLYLLSMDGDNAYFSYVPDYKRIKWYSIFDTDIDKPASDYELHDGIATRRFGKGLVAVNTREQEAVVALPKTYRNRLGDEVKELTLPPKSGEILFEVTAAKTESQNPVKFAIHGNYPNPFNALTTIEFSLSETGFITLGIYNMMGQNVKELITDTMAGGRHSVSWDGSDNNDKSVSSGIFFSQLSAPGRKASHRMMLLK